MIRESVAILVVAVLLVAVFLRSRHYAYSLTALPVALIPLLHLIIKLVLHISKGQFFGVRPEIATAFFDVLGLALSCVVIAIIANKISSKRYRVVYITLMLVYDIVIAWVYVYATLKPLLG